ncbi:MAG: DUF2683 family protein [Saprospiraceae bacterium]
MKTQDILIVHPQTSEQVTALKAFMQALKIKFEISNVEIYNQEFLKKIEESREQVKEGKVTRIKKEDLQSFVGL